VVAVSLDQTGKEILRDKRFRIRRFGLVAQFWFHGTSFVGLDRSYRVYKSYRPDS
jgi:hypothetical protein